MGGDEVAPENPARVRQDDKGPGRDTAGRPVGTAVEEVPSTVVGMATKMSGAAHAAQRQRLAASLQPVDRLTRPAGPSFVAGLVPVRAVRRAASIVHGIARVDGDGRVCDRAAFDAVGLVAGVGVTAVVSDDQRRVTVMLDSSSESAIDSRGRLLLTPNQRRRLGIASGSRVLVSADAEAHTLTVQPAACLDGLVRS